MKNILPILLISALLGGAAAVHAAPGVGGIDVTVRQKGGKVVQQARTDANGRFTTAQLEPGSYVMELRSKNAAAFRGTELAISVNSGKGSPVSQSTVPGGKFGGGVAMNIEVKKTAALQGQVTAGTRVTELGDTSTKGPPVAGTVRVINGKRYVWAPPEIGSQMGGRWVREGSPGAPAANISRGNQESLRRMQDHAGQGAVPGG